MNESKPQLLEFLQEDNGGLSCTRLISIIWATGVLIAWLVASSHEGKLVEIHSSVVTLMAIVITGKAVQKFGEQKTDSTDTAAASTGPNAVKPLASTAAVSTRETLNKARFSNCSLC